VAKDIFERLAKGRPAPLTKQEISPAQRLLDWLQRWNKPTVCMGDIRQHGPNSIRDRKIAADAAETLVRTGWLRPAKLHRYDMLKWEVIRKPIVAPDIST
jgi:hypothetical protein